MLPTLDYRDYFVIGFLSFFVLSLIISTCIWRKTTDDPKEPYADENYLISLFFIFIFFFIPPLCWYGDLPVGDFITATTVSTNDYKTVYKNNQGIDIEIKDATNYHIVLPSILNTTDISAESIDPKAPDDNYFIFSKNGVKESDERLTETVIAKDSPLKKDDPTGTKRIERIEFAKRTYRFKLWNYSTTRTENIARVTVSYQPDPQKTKKEDAIVKDFAQVNDKATVSDNSIISDNAIISGDATIYDKARVSDHAKVYESTLVCDKAHISNQAKIYGDSLVSGQARVSNDAQVFGSARINDKVTLSGHAKVYGNAMLNDSVTVTDYAKVYDDTYLNDRVQVRGFANVYSKAKLYNDVLITDSVHVFGKTKLEGSLHLINDAIISSSNDVFGFNDISQNRYLTYTVSNQTWIVDTVVIGNHQDLLDNATTDKAKTIYQHYIAIIESSTK